MLGVFYFCDIDFPAEMAVWVRVHCFHVRSVWVGPISVVIVMTFLHACCSVESEFCKGDVDVMFLRSFAIC